MTRTVTREQRTRIIRRPNKTITRSRHKTTTEGYGFLADAAARAGVAVSLAAFRTMKRVRTSKPVKTLNRKGPVKAMGHMVK